MCRKKTTPMTVLVVMHMCVGHGYPAIRHCTRVVARGLSSSHISPRTPPTGYAEFCLFIRKFKRGMHFRRLMHSGTLADSHIQLMRENDGIVWVSAGTQIHLLFRCLTRVVPLISNDQGIPTFPELQGVLSKREMNRGFALICHNVAEEDPMWKDYERMNSELSGHRRDSLDATEATDSVIEVRGVSNHVCAVLARCAHW